MDNDFKNVEKALNDYMVEVQRLYKDKLIADNKKATGNLINSIKIKIMVDGWNYIGALELADYWKYVEYGSKPHFPPISAILKWVKDKPVIPRPMNGITPTQQQLSFLIARKISRDGIKAGNQLRNTIEGVNASFMPILEDALAKDIKEYLGRITIL